MGAVGMLPVRQGSLQPHNPPSAGWLPERTPTAQCAWPAAPLRWVLQSLAIVMEYAAGGDMFSHLRDRRCVRLACLHLGPLLPKPPPCGLAGRARLLCTDRTSARGRHPAVSSHVRHRSSPPPRTCGLQGGLAAYRGGGALDVPAAVHRPGLLPRPGGSHSFRLLS